MNYCTKSKYITLFIIACAIVVCYYLTPTKDRLYRTKIKTVHKTDTTYQTITKVVYLPQPKYIRTIRLDTIVISKKEKDDTIITIPIEQKVYTDSFYTAYISGYKPTLDSIGLHLPKTIITNTTTTTITKIKPFTFGFTASVGYGIISKKIEPFIGVGVSLNLK